MIETTYTTHGKTFATLEEAERFETYRDKLLDADATLRTAIDDVKGRSFANGDGYVQQSEEAVDAYIARVGKVLLWMYPAGSLPDMWMREPRGFIGRYLDDGNDPAYRCWGRLQRIDSKFREWGQAYHALHPGRQGEWPKIKEATS